MAERLQYTGFLPWRGPFMLDAIVIGMVFVLIALAWSIYSVKYHHRYQRHKITQLCLSGGLLILLILFEIDIQFLENWRSVPTCRRTTTRPPGAVSWFNRSGSICSSRRRRSPSGS